MCGRMSRWRGTRWRIAATIGFGGSFTISEDSVTSVPVTTGRKRWVHSVESRLSQVGTVRNANSRPGSEVTTSHSLDQRSNPTPMRPRNLAPAVTLPVPGRHRAERHSGLNSPILVTSATRP